MCIFLYSNVSEYVDLRENLNIVLVDKLRTTLLKLRVCQELSVFGEITNSPVVVEIVPPCHRSKTTSVNLEEVLIFIEILIRKFFPLAPVYVSSPVPEL